MYPKIIACGYLRSGKKYHSIKTYLLKRSFTPMVYFAHKIYVYTFVLEVLVCRECDFNITHKNATIIYSLHLKHNLLELHHCTTMISNPLIDVFRGDQKYILAVECLKKTRKKKTKDCKKEKQLNKL